MKIRPLNKRKVGAGILIASGLVALIIPFLFAPHLQPVTTPPPPGGNNGGGGNGGTTPPCTQNCAQTTDNQPPQTAIQITGMIGWIRNSIQFYYPNFTLILHAIDDENLSSIVLNDTGTVTTFKAQGKTSIDMITVTINGVHTLSYFSTDRAGNKETPHLAIVGLAKPDFSDLQSLIANSGINNSGIKNALTVKVETAQDQLAAGQSPNGLDALANQLNALASKHGLDQARVDLMLMMIAAITG